MTEEITVPSQVDRPPLTDWKKEPTVMQLRQDYEDSRSNHVAQVARVDGWLDQMYIRNGAKAKGGANSSKIVPQLIRKQAEWRYASLSEPFLSSENIFDVSPVTWEDRNAAQQNQLVLNNQFNNRINKQQFVDDYVRTAVDEGTVVVKIGWEYRDRQYMEQVPIIELIPDQTVLPQIQQVLQLQQESPDQYSQLPEEVRQAAEMSVKDGVAYRGVITGYQEREATQVLKNQPTVEVCDYRNVVIDPSCAGDLSKAQFIIHMFESSMAELKADGRYKNLDFIGPEGTSILGEPDYAPTSSGTKNFNFSDKARKKFVVHEYWGFRDIDGSGTLLPIVGAWVGNTLIRLEENPFPDRQLPFVAVPYLPVRRDVYGESDGSLLGDNQKIAGAVTRGLIDLLAKSANSQTGLQKGALDAVNRRRFDRGEDYEFNAGNDPRTAIHQHIYPPIPDSAQFMLQLQNAEAESLTGVKAFANGISGAALGDTATGVRGALDAASKRELGILRRLSYGIVCIGRKMISMNAEFLSEEEVIRITNAEFIKVRRDDLPGTFDLKLTISTAEEDNNKAQELAFMLQTMGNNMDPEMSKMILSDIARLRKMPDLAHKIEQYQPQPDPIAQQKAQLEVLLLQAQIATEQAKAAHFGSGAQLQGAKANTEQVKQAHVQSQTDLNNLDFVEQETGTKQTRDLEKQGAQARANTQLEVVKAGLKMATEPPAKESQ